MLMRISRMTSFVIPVLSALKLLNRLVCFSTRV